MKPPGEKHLPLAPRSAARVAAVQALYQMDLAGTDLTDLIAEFMTLRFGPDAEDQNLKDADQGYFTDVVKGVVRRQREIDPMIDQQLAQGWRLNRIDSILRAVLRAGVFELMERADVPGRVIISEYIKVAQAFLSDDEPKVVNGVLDRLARKLRAGEFGQPG
ncbi:MAG: transcription antitermination factor NusB [Hyphomicrobiaceae bacterium]